MAGWSLLGESPERADEHGEEEYEHPGVESCEAGALLVWACGCVGVWVN